MERLRAIAIAGRFDPSQLRSCVTNHFEPISREPESSPRRRRCTTAVATAVPISNSTRDGPTARPVYTPMLCVYRG